MFRNVMAALIGLAFLMAAAGCDNSPCALFQSKEKVQAAGKVSSEQATAKSAAPAESVKAAEPAKAEKSAKPVAPAKPAKPAVAKVPAGKVALPEGKLVTDLKATVPVPATDKPVKVDGKLDDAAWRNATAVAGFKGEEGKQPSAQTRVLLTHDADNLYVAVINDEPKTGELVAKAAARDGEVWSDDCVELYVDAENSKDGEYYGFFVNAKNVVYDRQRVEAWDGKWESATQVVPNKAWVVEYAIPFKTIGVTVKPGAKLGLLAARNRTAANKEGEYTTLVSINDSKNTDRYPTFELK